MKSLPDIFQGLALILLALFNFISEEDVFLSLMSQPHTAELILTGFLGTPYQQLPLLPTSSSPLDIALLPLPTTVHAEAQPHNLLRTPQHGEGES